MPSPVEERSSTTEQQEERFGLGLIAYLSRHAVDEDYGWVSRNAPGLGGRGARVAAALTMALFGLLVLVAASQTTRGTAAATKERDQLIDQITSRRASVDARLDQARRLQADNQRLALQTATGAGGGEEIAGVRTLSATTGFTKVVGPGVKVVVDDAPGADSDRERVLDKDLQRLVNALWESGAEALSVNGQRLTTRSPVRQAGGAINVNFVPLRPPYTVLAIGDRARIPARFAATTDGAAWLDLEQQVGLRLTMTGEASLSLPAADPVTLRYATPGGSK